MSTLITIALILFVVWILALTIFKIAGFALHLLLIIAIIAFVVGMLRRVR